MKVHGTSPSTAPSPPFRYRRERLGEWATVLVLLLGVALWICWPRDGLRRPPSTTRLPEPGAAFVQVDFPRGALMRRTDRTGIWSASRSDPVLPLLSPMPPPPVPPPPPYTAITMEPVPLPPEPPPARRAPPPLSIDLPGPVFAAAAMPPEPAVRPLVWISPALRIAGFQTGSMPETPAGQAGRVVYRVTLGSDGRVAGLLEESSVAPRAAHTWRRAVLAGRGVTNASGVVVVGGD